MTDKQDHLFHYLAPMLSMGIEPGDREEEFWQRYGETVAVLTLDTAGFTRIARSHGILHFLSRLIPLRELCEQVFNSHNCRQLRFEADNAYATFLTVDDALRSAQAIHHAIFDRGLMLDDVERMQVSIGIGYGDLLYSETREGHFGEEMNYASKLGEDIGKGDETLITERAYREASPELVSGFSLAAADISGITLPHHRRRFEPPDMS